MSTHLLKAKEGKYAFLSKEWKSRSRFLSLGTTDVLNWVIVYCGELSMYYRMFSLYPVDARSWPLNPVWQPKTSSDIAQCPLGDKIAQLRTTVLDVL